MTSRTKYIFVTIPLKEAKGVSQNNQIGVDIPPSEIKMLEKKRIECLHAFSTIKKQTPDSLTLESTPSVKIIEYVDSYVSGLIKMVKLFPSFAAKYFYTWSSPLGEDQCTAYDDYRHELMAIYYNIAGYFVNVAQNLLCVRAKVGGMSSLEKDSYRVLLRAAGYFSLARNIADDIKLRPIGVAEMPYAPDDVIAFFNFLETLSLAQAQEIGTMRSIGTELKQSSDLTASLCHQLFIFYKQCTELSGRVRKCSTTFRNISVLCEIKSDVFSSLRYNYAASWAFNSSPSNGLWFLNRAKNEVANIQKRVKNTKNMKLYYGYEKLLETCYAAVERNDERLRKINSLVHHAKMAEGEIPLPIPQVLAVKEKIEFPEGLPQLGTN